ncbi:unnamed protein product, partial [Rotaria socialis]
MIREADIDG